MNPLFTIVANNRQSRCTLRTGYLLNRRILITTAFAICTALPFSTAQEEKADSIIIAGVFQEIISASSKKNTAKLYKENLQLIRYNSDVFDALIKHLLSRNQIEIANELLKTNPFLMSQHNERARYFYYLGVCQMLDERGWPYFKQAERSLHAANMELRRSASPDYGFFSDIENARGYLSIVARGLSSNDVQEPVCLVRWEYIYLAIDHYREALIYNPDNAFAQQNLDTLLNKLEMTGIDIPPNKYELNIVPNQSVSLDSVDIDSLNDVSSIPVLDYSLLPRNHQLILSELHAYEEIILLIDLSGSMDDPVAWSNENSPKESIRTKFRIAQQLAIFIAMNLRPNVFLGTITVGRECDSRSMALNYPIASVSRAELATQIDHVRPHGPTPLNRRMRMTKDMFSAKRNKKLVFLLSDGMDTCGEIPDLCGTAAMLAAHGIDLSIFSFIYEAFDAESRSAYAIYQCMVRPSEGTIYKITEDGGVDDQIDYVPVSNNILVLPPMDTSVLWSNNPVLFQFVIENVEPPVDRIIRFDD
ncbi:MAG: hypothetical protein DRI69_07380 [Bacteroidetes bacterium]|nr:MAG: hypothetical protein DRI69_07380 [Bacteroidota bacterium]